MSFVLYFFGIIGLGMLVGLGDYDAFDSIGDWIISIGVPGGGAGWIIYKVMQNYGKD